MVRSKIYIFQLTDDEHSKLDRTIKNKVTYRMVMKRCQILREIDLKYGYGLMYVKAARAVCPSTVTNLIQDYVNKGINYIIQYHISPSSAAALRKADGAYSGNTDTDCMCFCTSRAFPLAGVPVGVLKNELRLGRNDYWCIHKKENTEFASRMEDILEIYEMSYDPEKPVACMDEKPCQLLG